MKTPSPIASGDYSASRLAATEVKKMIYDEIAKASEQLSYRDKFRLAQLLIQLAMKEEEEEYPQERKEINTSGVEVVQYVAERLLNLWLMCFMQR